MAEPVANEPLVTVIVPVFNRAALVAHALTSVMRQDYDRLEVIVVDDGSVDRPELTVHAVGDPRIRFHRHPSNRGAAAARNTGVEHAQGELLAFLDSDDTWCPQKVRRQVEWLQRHNDADAVCAGVELWQPNNGLADRRIPAARDCTLAGLLDGCTVSPGSTLMVRRHVFHTIGDFDVRLSRLEDWDWLLRFARSHRLEVVPEVLARVNVGGWPSVDTVRAAVQAMRSRHVNSDDTGLGNLEKRRLLASLEIEIAAAHAAAGHTFQTFEHLVQAGLMSPSRLLSLIKRRLLRGRRSRSSTNRLGSPGSD